MQLINIKQEDEFKALRNKNLLVVHFKSEWAPQCQQMGEVLCELGKDEDLKDVTFSEINAEDFPLISSEFEIEAVPTFVILRNGDEVDRINGANAAELTTKVKAHASKFSLLSMVPTLPNDALNARLKQLVNSHKCMVFMKGSPESSKCPLSKNIIDILNSHNADYGYFDILSNEEICQGLKSFSNSPSYPQLYLDGVFVGGLDVVREKNQNGELGNLLPKKLMLDDRLKTLINKAELMVFMKGNLEEPRCGFSKQLMEILKETGLGFKTFDILSDEEVRQGLKKYSNWPTYPQIYVKGELVGGLDIIKDLKADGSLLPTLKGE